jgi:hypothetical protein
MLQKISLRPTTQAITIEQQLAADRAEDARSAALRNWRRGWYVAFVEIVAIACAANRRDLDGVCLHHDHLRIALMNLRLGELR